MHRSSGFGGPSTRRVALAVALVALALGCERPEPGPAARPVDQSRAKSRFDSAVFDRSLRMVVAWHDSTGTGWAPPAGPAADAVVERFEGLGFSVNDELQALWSRLAPGPDDPPLFFDYVLLSADRARARYDALRGDHTIPWRPNWIPVLEAGERWLAVESSRSTAPAGPVVFYRTGTTPVVAFTNLTRLFEALAVALADSTTRAAPGEVVIDRAVFAAAHAATNGDLPLPTDVAGD